MQTIVTDVCASVCQSVCHAGSFNGAFAKSVWPLDHSLILIVCVTVYKRCWLKESRSQWIVSGPILVMLLVSTSCFSNRLFIQIP